MPLSNEPRSREGEASRPYDCDEVPNQADIQREIADLLPSVLAHRGKKDLNGGVDFATVERGPGGDPQMFVVTGKENVSGVAGHVVREVSLTEPGQEEASLRTVQHPDRPGVTITLGQETSTRRLQYLLSLVETYSRSPMHNGARRVVEYVKWVLFS